MNTHSSSYIPDRRQPRVAGWYPAIPAIPAAPAVPARGRLAWWKAAAILAGLIAAAFLIAGGLALSALRADRILPGVSVGGAAIGGLTRAHAAALVDRQWNDTRRIRLMYGDQAWTVTPLELGLWVDAIATVERAYQVGRSGGWSQALAQLLSPTQRSVAPVVVYSAEVARSRLEALGAELFVAPREAALVHSGGKWVAVPGENGLALDLEGTLSKLSANAEAVLSYGALPVLVQPVPPRLADASSLLAQIEAAAALPLRLRAYDPITDEALEWTVPADVLGGWLVVEQRGEQLSFTLDPTGLPAYLEAWKAGLAPLRTLEPYTLPGDLTAAWQAGETIQLQIRHQAYPYTVQPGETLLQVAFQVGMPYWKIQQANPGQNLDRLSPGQILTIPSPNEMLPLPVVQHKRIVVSISQQRMWTYENGELHREYVVSTGIARSPTYPGVYQVQTQEIDAYASAWDLRMPYFMGIYEGWPGFMNGIHGLPLLSNGVRLWGNVLGKPASYGCIILSMADSEELYGWAEAGVVVEIRR